MIGHWWLETVRLNSTTNQDEVQKTVFPYEDYGLFMVEYDAPPPATRVFRTTIEGRDGQLDLTEWEGQGIIRYNDRTVTVKVRELDGRANTSRFIGAVLGRRVHLHFDDEPEYYYVGRCDKMDSATRNHVTDTTITFTCQPYRESGESYSDSFTVEPGTENQQTGRVLPAYADKIVKVGCAFTVPVITASGISGLGDNVDEIAIYTSGVAQSGPYAWSSFTEDGVVDIAGAMLTQGDNCIRAWNRSTTASLTISVTWREGVI